MQQIPSSSPGFGVSDRPLPRPITFGRFNLLGLWTLYLKEVRRFINVLTQTVMAPMVTALLFLAVFTLALGRGGSAVEGFPYAVFLAPGLIMMTMLQNAFANTSSSMVISKVQGNVVDVLMPPLSPGELVVGYAGGGLTRGLIVGLATALAMRPFVPFGIHEPFFLLYHAVMASLMLSLLGLIGGIWAEKFDHIAAVTNFIIVPASFLSGTFYAVHNLPGNWVLVAHFNPFFYLIDGFRFGLIGWHDGNLLVGLVLVAAVNLVLFLVALRMFARGYKLKP